jgi:hypothetical protein
MPLEISTRLPPTESFVFPANLAEPDGPCVSGEGEVISLCGDQGVGCLTFIESKLSWLDDYEHFVFHIDPDGNRKAIRKATEEDIKTFRVPIWIQGDEVPICCGQEMVFVGQIDDNVISTERPKDADRWWHDAASFYVFTCSRCLECKAVGQQF